MTTPTLIAVDVALATQGWETRELTLSRDIGHEEVAPTRRNGSARTAGHGRYRR